MRASAASNKDAKVYVKPRCLLVYLSDRQGVCHPVAGLAPLSAVTFLLLPPWLFCALVIAVL